MIIRRIQQKICVNVLGADFGLTLFKKEDKKCLVKKVLLLSV